MTNVLQTTGAEKFGFELLNFRGNDIETINYNGTALFNPKHIGACLDITKSTVRNHLIEMDESKRVLLKAKDSDLLGRKINNRGLFFITESGVLELCAKSKRTSKDKVFDLLTTLGIDKTPVLQRKEFTFLEQLEQTLQPLGISGNRQYSVNGYRIDYYIQSMNVAIEYDENDHKKYTYEQQELRQQIIEKELGCRFIRVSDSNTHAYNVGLVIKELFNINQMELVA